MGLSGENQETFADHYIYDVVLAQNNPDIIWVAHNTYLARSTDGGQTWLPIEYSAMQESCINCSPGIDLGRTCRILATHPLTSETVYVGTSGPHNTGTGGAVFKSEDGGRTWIKLNHGNNLDYAVKALALDPADPNILWAGTNSDGYEGNWDGSIYRSLDGGQSWECITPMITDEIFETGEINAIVPHPLASKVIFVGCYKGLLRLQFDQGQWRVSESGSVVGDFSPSAIKISPSDHRKIYASGQGRQAAEDGGHAKIWYSTNGGATWRKRADIPAHLSGIPFSLAVHPANADRLFLGDFSLGLTGSMDGGTIWSPLNQGLDAVRVLSLDTDPEDHTHLLAASDAGVFERRNSKAWVNLLHGSFFSVRFDPVDSRTYYAGGNGCVYKTVDGGRNWIRTESEADIQSRWVTDIDVDPADNSKVFIVTKGTAPGDAGLIMRSTDGGVSFNTMHRGLNQAGKGYYMNTILVDPTNSLHILAGGGNFYFPHELGDLWRSTDGGIHWDRTGLTNTIVNAVLIDPVDARIWYAGCGYNDAMDSGWTLLKSTDGGTSWEAAADGMPSSGKRAVTSLVFNRTDSNIIYASTLKAGVFMSPNKAGHWLELAKPPVEVYALASGSLYAGTNRGVFQFSGTGVLAGRVSCSNTKLGIDGATVSTDFGNACYCIEGDYMMVTSAGIFDVNASARGYTDTTIADIPVLGSEVTWCDFAISRDNGSHGESGSSARINGAANGGYCFVNSVLPSTRFGLSGIDCAWSVLATALHALMWPIN
jgi:photosystem II stability/assembly factor-like uncharacterized protein